MKLLTTAMVALYAIFTSLLPATESKEPTTPRTAESTSTTTRADTNLYFGCLMGKLAEVQKAIADGANVNGSSEYSIPIFLAINNDTPSILECLLDAQANPNVYDLLDRSTLTYAAEKNSTPMVQTLINHGAYINLQTKDGYAALTAARNNNNHELIALLRKAAQCTPEDLERNPNNTEATLWAPKTHPAMHLKNPAGLCWLIGTINIIQQLRSVRQLLDDIQDKRVFIKPAPEIATPEGQEYQLARNLIDALYGVIIATTVPDNKKNIYYADDFFRAYYAYGVHVGRIKASRLITARMAYVLWTNEGGDPVVGWYTIMRALHRICPHILSSEYDDIAAQNINVSKKSYLANIKSKFTITNNASRETSMGTLRPTGFVWFDGPQQEQTFDAWFNEAYPAHALTYIIPVQCAQITQKLNAPLAEELLPRSFVTNGLRYHLRTIECHESFVFGQIGHCIAYHYGPNGGWIDEGTGVFSGPRVIKNDNFIGYASNATKKFDDIERDLRHGFCGQLKFHREGKSSMTRKKIRASVAYYEQDLSYEKPVADDDDETKKTATMVEKDAADDASRDQKTPDRSL